MELFQIEEDQPTFSPQALALKPFEALWKRDRTKGKRRAFQELSYIYYVVDYKSILNHIVDIETRKREAQKMINFPKNWKEDSKLEEAMEFYKEIQTTPALQALEAQRIGLFKINEYIKDATVKDAGEAKKIMEMSKLLDGAIESLQKVEERVKKELENKAELKGQADPAMFEQQGSL